MKTHEDDMNDKPKLPLDNNSSNAFGLPLDYFASFEQKLNQKLEAENELEEFPLLSSVDKKTPFTLPQHYFKSLQNSLEYKEELEPYINLQALKKTPYPVLEEEYKSYIATSLNYKIELSEELISYTTLHSIDKALSFVAPVDYFENVGGRIKEKMYSAKEIKVSLRDKLFHIIFGKKMALTFGILCITALSLYFNQSQDTIIGQGDCKTLACLEQHEILNNKAISNFDDEQLMDLANLNSLNKQLTLGEQKKDSVSLKDNYLKNKDIDELLDGL